MGPTCHLFLALKMESDASSGTLLIAAIAPAIRTHDYRLKSITVVGIEGGDCFKNIVQLHWLV